MLVACTLLAGCKGNTLATAHPTNEQIDVFNQLTRAKSDILWVVDSSGSMAREQQQLADSFPRFFGHLQDSGVDYRIAVTTADVFAQAGDLVGTPAVIAGNSSDPGVPDTLDPQAAFAANIHVGIQGSARDEAFESAQLAIAKLQAAAGAAADAGAPVAFLRSDAALFLIFVGDGREYSPPVAPPPGYNLPGVQTYWRQYLQAKGIGDNGLVSVSAIAGDTPNGCVPVGCSGDAGVDGGISTDPGFRYQELAELAGGIFHSICDCNFNETLDQLGVQALGLTHKFRLSRQADPTTLKIVVDSACGTSDPQNNLYCLPLAVDCPSGYGGACTGQCETLGLQCTVPEQLRDGGNSGDGWSYDPNDNAITLNGLSLPAPGAKITVSYTVAGTP